MKWQRLVCGNRMSSADVLQLICMKHPNVISALRGLNCPLPANVLRRVFPPLLLSRFERCGLNSGRLRSTSRARPKPVTCRANNLMVWGFRRSNRDQNPVIIVRTTSSSGQRKPGMSFAKSQNSRRSPSAAELSVRQLIRSRGE